MHIVVSTSICSQHPTAHDTHVKDDAEDGDDVANSNSTARKTLTAIDGYLDGTLDLYNNVINVAGSSGVRSEGI